MQRDDDHLDDDEQHAERERLREPDRTTADRRQEQRVEDARIALGGERPAERQRSSEQEDDPEDAAGEARRDLPAIPRDREMERHERPQREQPDPGEQLG